MGDLTLAELQEEINANLGDRGSDDDPGLTRITRHINLVQRKIARAYNFQEMQVEDEVTITPTGTLAADAIYVIEEAARLKDLYSLVRVGPGSTVVWKLRRLSQMRWAKLIGDAKQYSVGDPTHYLHRPKGTIRWYRIPDTEFTLVRRYTQWPADLSTSTEYSSFEKKDDLIINWATYELFSSLGEQADAARYLQKTRITWVDAISEEGNKPDLVMVPEVLQGDSGEYQVDPWLDPFEGL